MVSCSKSQTKLEELENELKEINANQERMDRNLLELTEYKHILRETANFFEEVSATLSFVVK